MPAKKSATKGKKSAKVEHSVSDLTLKQQNRIRAAQFIAEGKMSLQEIAAKVGVDAATLWRWRRDDAFKTMVQQFSSDLWGEIKARALGRLDSWMASNKFEESIGAIDRILGMGEFAPPAPKGDANGSSVGGSSSAIVVVAGKDDDWTRYVTDRVDPGTSPSQPEADGDQGPLVT